MTRRPPRSTLLPYATRFRSADRAQPAGIGQRVGIVAGIRIEVAPARVADGIWRGEAAGDRVVLPRAQVDRKSTRLNSSHANISYAVFCLKKNDPCLRARRGG